MDEEVQNWANEMIQQGGLKPEDLAAILGNDKAAGYVKKSLKAQSDYSRQMDKLREKETQIAEKETGIIAVQEELIDWKENKAEPQLRAANRALEKLHGEKAVIMTRLRTLQDAYQIPAVELDGLLTGENTPPSKDEAPPAFITREDFTKEANQVVGALPRMVGVIRQIEREHEKLFGPGSFPDMEALMADQESTRAKLTEVWEKKYGVPAKRQEMEMNARKAEIEKGIREGVNAKLSEMNLPGERIAGRGESGLGSPVLHGLKPITAPSPAEHQPVAVAFRQPGQLARNAAQAWAEGKYRRELKE